MLCRNLHCNCSLNYLDGLFLWDLFFCILCFFWLLLLLLLFYLFYFFCITLGLHRFFMFWITLTMIWWNSQTSWPMPWFHLLKLLLLFFNCILKLFFQNLYFGKFFNQKLISFLINTIQIIHQFGIELLRFNHKAVLRFSIN